MNHIDIYLQEYFSAMRTAGTTKFFYVLTSLFDLSFSFLLIVLCVAVLIYLVRNIKYTFLFLGTLFSGSLIVYILKNIFNINRPPNAVLEAFGQSFPSYHATISVIFFLLLIYIFDDYLSGVWRRIFNLFCIISFFLVSFSRIYLGVHWFSDVFYGIILGCVITYISILIFRRVMIVK